jgi:hypothetical protein
MELLSIVNGNSSDETENKSTKTYHPVTGRGSYPKNTHTYINNWHHIQGSSYVEKHLTMVSNYFIYTISIQRLPSSSRWEALRQYGLS